MDTVKEKLCGEKTELKDKKIIFLLDDKELDVNKTLEENQIKNKKSIVIKMQKDILNKGKKTSKKNNNEGKKEENKKEESKINKPKVTNNEDEEISVIIKSSDQAIKSSFLCKKGDKFKILEQKLYKRFPNLKKEEHYYLCNGNIIDIEKTIEENKIKDGANILYNINEADEKDDINVIIKSIDQNIEFSFKCKKSEKFKLVEKKLYEKYPNLKNEEHYYICNGIKIDIEKTIEQNKIKDNDNILYNIHIFEQEI